MKLSKEQQLEKAIEDIREAYAQAQKLYFVNDPLCYALYHVWDRYNRKAMAKNYEQERQN